MDPLRCCGYQTTTATTSAALDVKQMEPDQQVHQSNKRTRPANELFETKNTAFNLAIDGWNADGMRPSSFPRRMQMPPATVADGIPFRHSFRRLSERERERATLPSFVGCFLITEPRTAAIDVWSTPRFRFCPSRRTAGPNPSTWLMIHCVIV